MNGKMKNLKLAALLGAMTIAFAGFGVANVASTGSFAAESIVASAATQDVATVNGVSHATLQEAVDAAQDGDTVIFNQNITEDVVITQKENINLVIDGNGKNFTGVMTVYGDGRHAGAETLTIKNINFYAVKDKDSCIISPSKGTVFNKYSYSHNVTVEDCKFYGNTSTSYDLTTAIRQSQAGDQNWTIKNCFVDENMHSLLQVKNINSKLVVDGCTVNSKNGLNLNSCTNVEISNCDINVKGHAVRAGVNSGGNPNEDKTFIFKNNVLKSEGEDGDAVVIFRKSSSNTSLDMSENVVSGTTHIDVDSAATDVEVSANGNYWADATGITQPKMEGVTATIDYSYAELNPDGSINTEKLGAKIGDVKYTTLKDAIAAANEGDTIELISNELVVGDWGSCNLPANVTIDGNGYALNLGKIIHYGANAAFYSAGAYNVVDLTISCEVSSNAMAFDMKNGGSLTNVVIKGAFLQGVYVGGEVEITNSVFGESVTYGIYSENAHVANINIQNNTFNGERAGVFASSVSGEFTNNVVNGDKGLSLATSNVEVTENKFYGKRALSISASATVSGNIFGGVMTCVELDVSADLSGNYWAAGVPNVQPQNENAVPTINSYYTELNPDGSINTGNNDKPEGTPDDDDEVMFPGLNDILGGLLGAMDIINSQNNANNQAESDGIGAAGVVAIVAGSLAVVIAAGVCVLWVLEKKEIFKVSEFLEKVKKNLKK